jgi:hypothetical protein
MLVMVFGQLAVGCASNKPKYVAPELPAEQKSTLKGGWSTFIEEIDDSNVEHFEFTNLPGNTVEVTPGEHKLKVTTVVGSGSPAAGGGSGFSASFGINNTDRTTVFHFRCEPGHVYKFSRYSLWSLTLEIDDLTTGQSMTIEKSEE